MLVFWLNAEWVVLLVVGFDYDASRGSLQAFEIDVVLVVKEIDGIAHKALFAHVDKHGGAAGNGGGHAVAGGADEFDVAGVAPAKEFACLLVAKTDYVKQLGIFV